MYVVSSFILLTKIKSFRLAEAFWGRWNEFELQHGNEETMRELLRIKRSVQAKFNTSTGQIVPPAAAVAAATPGTGEGWCSEA